MEERVENVRPRVTKEIYMSVPHKKESIDLLLVFPPRLCQFDYAAYTSTEWNIPKNDMLKDMDIDALVGN
jgi:hypothetical protein